MKAEVDWSHQNSLHNWVEHLDMACSSESDVGMLGALYFAGFLGTIGIAGRLGDLIGRRKLIFTGQTIQTLCCIAFVFMGSLNQAKFFMFFYGLGCGLNFGPVSALIICLPSFCRISASRRCCASGTSLIGRVSI